MESKNERTRNRYKEYKVDLISESIPFVVLTIWRIVTWGIVDLL